MRNSAIYMYIIFYFISRFDNRKKQNLLPGVKTVKPARVKDNFLLLYWNSLILKWIFFECVCRIFDKIPLIIFKVLKKRHADILSCLEVICPGFQKKFRAHKYSKLVLSVHGLSIYLIQKGYSEKYDLYGKCKQTNSTMHQLLLRISMMTICSESWEFETFTWCYRQKYFRLFLKQSSSQTTRSCTFVMSFPVMFSFKT